MDRFQNHFYLTNRKDNPNEISKHFNSRSHEGTKDMKIHIVDFIHMHPESETGSKIRDQIEMNWIHRLHTQQPIGLNMMDNPSADNSSVSKNWKN